MIDALYSTRKGPDWITPVGAFLYVAVSAPAKDIHQAAKLLAFDLQQVCFRPSTCSGEPVVLLIVNLLV
jgi:hypothetical protein